MQRLFLLMNNQELIPNLFKTEFRKITSVLCRHFGIEHIEVAEDIASETFLAAMEIWPYKGIPQNPTAWLYSVAKNKTLNYIKRNYLFATKIKSELKNDAKTARKYEIDLSDKNITDSQLQMLFAICHPSIPVEAQIALALRVLCGFGIDEIANAFLTNKEVVNKRLFRAKEKLRQEKVKIEFSQEAEINKRLETVLTTLYLLYNEGYYSESENSIVRKDLCLEAMRLCKMLIENADTNKPEVNALLSLMCFHASRFEARRDEKGEMILYEDQDTSLWNKDLISKGKYFLNCSATGANISKYHFEAAIAYWHTKKADTKEKWQNILQLYNQLLILEYSPVAALNRTYALSKVKGKKEAIAEAEKLQIEDNHFYHSLLGELYTNLDNIKAKECFKKALALSKTQPEQHNIQKKIDKLDTVTL